MNRNKVYEAIDSERYYQDRKWGSVQEHPHEVGAWITLMRKLLTDAEVAWASSNGDYKALVELRKVLAVGVACAEQHGLPARSLTQPVNTGEWNMTTELNLEVAISLAIRHGVIDAPKDAFGRARMLAFITDYASSICADKDAEIATQGQQLEALRVNAAHQYEWVSQKLIKARAEIERLNALIAMKDEALNTCTTNDASGDQFFSRDKVFAAISATPESVQAWRRELEAKVLEDFAERFGVMGIVNAFRKEALAYAKQLRASNQTQEP